MQMIRKKWRINHKNLNDKNKEKIENKKQKKRIIEEKNE